MSNLAQALRSFIEDDDLADTIGQVLACADESSYISYSQVEEIAGPNSEDVLLLGFGWRLLLPVRTSRCSEWDDRVLLAEPDEKYELPNVVKYLVKNARQTGEWDSERAITELFKIMREPAWDRMPMLVGKLISRSENYVITAAQIQQICDGLELEDRVDGLIAELKGSGVMSPKLGDLARLARSQEGPIYELNPCLFKD